MLIGNLQGALRNLAVLWWKKCRKRQKISVILSKKLGEEKMQNVRSKIVPTMFAKIKNWINDNNFIAICNGKEILCHKDYWIID